MFEDSNGILHPSHVLAREISTGLDYIEGLPDLSDAELFGDEIGILSPDASHLAAKILLDFRGKV